MRFALLIISGLALGLTAACSPNPAVVRTTSKGPALTDVNSMTMYTFDKDKTPGKSVCNGQCAVAWPPLKAYSNDAGAGDWTIITRDDGTYQWAYKGKPLYGWFKDKAPGDATGDGVHDVGHIATP
jgi:predicted lipoprotein with Yx(FWY)xxD motif